MSTLKQLPCGAWPSPLSPERAAAGAVALSYPTAHGGTLYWIEGRPAERGRSVLMAQRPGAAAHEVLPADANVRSRVHEYGGMPYVLVGDQLVWSRFEDQRLCAQPVSVECKASEQALPRLLTPPGCRYADGAAHPGGQALVAVCEDHRGPGEARSSVVWLDLQAPTPVRDDPAASAGQTLYADSDFVAWPRISLDGTRLALVAWDHPNMPWDETRLLVGRLDGGQLHDLQVVAGGPGESVLEPHWAGDGTLYFLSDRSGWWNLYRWRAGQTVTAVTQLDAELGGPLWVLGSGAYTLLNNRRALVRIGRGTVDQLALLDLHDGRHQPLELPYVAFGGLCRVDDHTVGLLASSVDQPPALITLTLPASTGSERTVLALEVTLVKSAGQAALAPQAVSRGLAVDFETVPGPDGHARRAHAWFYPPCLPGMAPRDDELPPLLVLLHGGPTSHAGPAYKTTVQFWTSRGYAVVDVNYGGSSGYGRDYRDRLRGQWGVVDLQDAVAAVDHLVAQGLVDGQRVAIRGGSAGGYTVLSALAFTQRFAAGINYYGVADLETLVADTHKFEARYVDSLVAPLPQGRAVYRQRSPVHHMGQCRAALLTLQGSEDRAVPPQQSRDVVAAARAAGCPVAYLEFDGEGHGFRQSANIVRGLQAELAFLGRVFRYTPAEDLPLLDVDNAQRL
jgi:dipeptidyl aminopeptidase/acylaminoacyl peptidase